MKPFERAIIPPEEIERNIAMMFEQWQDAGSEIRRLYKETDPVKAKAQIMETITRMMCDEMVFLNDTYQVHVRRVDEGMLHLSIKRIDKQPVHDWRDLQWIKSEIVGPENEAVEIYPAESRVIDTANQYHLWVFIDPTYRIPFGFNAGRVLSEKPIGKSVNRPFQQSVTPPVAA